MSLLKNSKSKPGDKVSTGSTGAQRELTPEQAQIQRLKDKISVLTKENEKLQSQLPPKTDIGPKGDTMQITSSIDHDGRVYKYSQSIEFGEAFKELAPILRQVMTITKAASLGHDVLNKRQAAHVIGLDGKPTKDLMKDEEGKQIYLPNACDRLRAAFDLLLEDPESKKALAVIGQKLQDTDSLKEKAQAYSSMARLKAALKKSAGNREDDREDDSGSTPKF